MPVYRCQDTTFDTCFVRYYHTYRQRHTTQAAAFFPVVSYKNVMGAELSKHNSNARHSSKHQGVRKLAARSYIQRLQTMMVFLKTPHLAGPSGSQNPNAQNATRHGNATLSPKARIKANKITMSVFLPTSSLRRFGGRGRVNTL